MVSDATGLILEQISIALADGLEQVLGNPVDIGLTGRFDDHEVTSRAIPLRVIQVEYTSGLDDCLIAITNMREDHVRDGLLQAARELGLKLEAQAVLGAAQSFEYTDRDNALEQLDGLYSEPTIHFTTPVGEMLVVVGSGLIKAARGRLRGRGAQFDLLEEPEEEFAIIPPAKSKSMDDEDLARPQTPLSGTDSAPIPIDRNSAENRVAAENAATAVDSEQWAELLSGVDVELSAELGRSRMRLGEIASLAEDSVLTLDQLVEEPVTVFVNGSPYATARLVVVDDEYGVEILEVIASPSATL